MLKIFEAMAVLLTCLATIIGALWFMEQRHAKVEQLEAAHEARVKSELRFSAELVDRDVRKDAEARVYYKNIERGRVLEPAEQIRLEYLERQMERKYKEQDMIQARIIEVESE